MRKAKSIVLAMIVLVSVSVLSCGLEPRVKGGLSVTFSSLPRSMTAVQESFEKNSFHWKYASRKVGNLPGSTDTSIDYEGSTESYDEAGAVFIHEGESGLEGSVEGFTEGVWDFTLYGYRRSGSEGNWSYSLVYSGEARNVELVGGAENSVAVVTHPVSDHGNGFLSIDPESIEFTASGEWEAESDFTRVVTVRRLEEKDPIEGSNGLYEVEPGLYLVNVRFLLNGYMFAEGNVVVTVYSNQTVTVTGDIKELVTFVDLDIPEA